MERELSTVRMQARRALAALPLPALLTASRKPAVCARGCEHPALSDEEVEMMQGKAWLLAAGLIGAAAPVQATTAADAEAEVYYGYARDLETGEYLYTERHEAVYRDGRWRRGRITYFDVEGRKLGDKTLDFSRHPHVPLYHLRLDSGYEEGISGIDDGQVTMFRKKAGGEREVEQVQMSPPMAADSGFHSLIVEHLDELVEGEKKRFSFGVAGSLDSFRFRVRKLEDTRFEDDPAVLLKVEAASLLRLVAPSLELVYDPVSRRLLEYRGISNLQNPETGDNYSNVRISYLSEPPPEAQAVPGITAD